MRDVVILILLVVATVWALRAPWTGAISWTLVSLMSPHVQFGYAAADWPVATGVALSTMTGLLLTKDRQNPLFGVAPRWLLAFVIWICITLPFSIYFEPSLALWQRSMKIFLMLFVTMALITDKHKLKVFIWVNVLAIGYYGVKGGLFTIATGGNHRVWGPGGFIEGNNEVALAAITVIPLMRYLQTQMTDKRARHVMTACMVLSVAMALGTQSRGALVGVMAMGAYFWLKSPNKLGWGIAIGVLSMTALSLMPEAWWQRMDTIKSYDSDASALGRINAWWTAFNLAKVNVFGGGFQIYTAEVFARYAPIKDDVHAAHSVYFQILGEHGFIGLFLFLGVGVATWWTSHKLIKAGRREPSQKWAADLGAMVQVSMIGFGATGAFLSLAYFDLPYNVMAIAALALAFVQREQASRVNAGIATTPLSAARPLSQRSTAQLQ